MRALNSSAVFDETTEEGRLSRVATLIVGKEAVILLFVVLSEKCFVVLHVSSFPSYLKLNTHIKFLNFAQFQRQIKVLDS